MELEEQVSLVDQIHSTVASYKGKKLKVKVNMGRSKVIDCEGILTEVHPSVFIVEVHGKRGRVTRQSHQYVDVLTGKVELTDAETGEKLFEPPFDN